MYGHSGEKPADDFKHVYKSLDIFWRWSRIGFIGGQQKSKYGTIRWYAHLGPIKDLHDIFKIGHMGYRWDPLDHPVKDFINNMSKFLFRLTPVMRATFLYEKLIYNIAYRHAVYASPGYEKEILDSCDHDEVIWGMDKLRAKYGTDWERKE